MLKLKIVFVTTITIFLFSNIIYSQSNFTQMEQTTNVNRIQVILTIDTDNLPNNFQEIIKHEQEVIAKWKAEGILENLFLRQTKNGAILIFKETDELKVKSLMQTLPLYQLKKSVEYFHLIKQF